MKITREAFKNIVRETMIEESEYQDFFKRALEKTGKSIPDMSDEEKKAFFNKIDAAWKGKGEKKNEGNAFGAAVSDAKEKGEDEFEVGGEKFKVESVNETKFYAFFNNKKHEIEGQSLLDAKQKAILQLKVPKSKVGLLAVVNASEHDKGSFRYESVSEAKYPTDLKIGSVIMGQGFTRLKGVDGGKYYKVVAMDDTTATLVPSDKNGNTKGSTKVRHKLDSIEGGIKTAKRGDENGIVVIKESVNEAGGTVRNPKTGKDVKISTALSYGKSHPAYQAAKQASGAAKKPLGPPPGVKAKPPVNAKPAMGTKVTSPAPTNAKPAMGTKVTSAPPRNAQPPVGTKVTGPPPGVRPKPPVIAPPTAAKPVGTPPGVKAKPPVIKPSAAPTGGGKPPLGPPPGVKAKPPVIAPPSAVKKPLGPPPGVKPKGSVPPPPPPPPPPSGKPSVGTPPGVKAKPPVIAPPSAAKAPLGPPPGVRPKGAVPPPPPPPPPPPTKSKFEDKESVKEKKKIKK